MAFMRPYQVLEPHPALRSGPVLLRAPQMADHAEWAALRGASSRELMPYEPLWSFDELSRFQFRERVRRAMKDRREDRGYTFLVVRDSDRVLIGGISLSNVRRGAMQAATVGYWIGTMHAGRGYASQALAAAADYAFASLGLHRLEAACMPANAASLRVLEKQGFHREGLARRYLCINGRWEDHLLHARLGEDPTP